MHSAFYDRLPLDLQHQLDALCDRFEADWHAGRPWAIELALERFPAEHRAAACVELVQLEIQLRRARGEPIGIDEYARRFPQEAEYLAQLDGFRDLQEESESAPVAEDSTDPATEAGTMITNSTTTSDSKVPRTAGTLQGLGDLFHFYPGLVPGRIHDFVGGYPYQINASCFQKRQVFFQVARVSRQILLRSKLSGVDEDTYRHCRALSPGAPHQG